MANGFRLAFRHESCIAADVMITLLSGTNRPDSNTRKITAQVEALYRDLGVPVQVLELEREDEDELSTTLSWKET